MDHLVASSFDLFSHIFLKILIEFPCELIATLTFSFAMNFFRFFMKMLTRFSTIAKLSPFGGGVLYPRCTTLYSSFPRKCSAFFLSLGSRFSRASPSFLRFRWCSPIFFMNDLWEVPSRSP